MAANWSEIPEELVDLVAERLVCIDDLVRFGAVCKPWRAVSIVKKEKVSAPLIMLAKAENDNLPTEDEGNGVRSFIIPYGEEKMRRFDVELSKAQGRKCWGSPYGWLVTIGVDFQIHLLNPFTAVQLPLPSHPTLQQLSKVPLPEGLTPAHTIRSFTPKFVLGRKPSEEEELIVMAIFGQDLEVAFCVLPGKGIEPTSSSSWTLVESDFNYIADVLLFEGRIYMISLNGRLGVCDINHTPPKEIHILSIPEGTNSGSRFYLVEIGGCLHLVARVFECFDGPSDDYLDFHFRTIDFLVYRLNSLENKWDDVYDLEEHALFVGNHTSFAISTITYPHFSPNSVYFTDDHYTGYKSRYCDTGVYNYEDGSIEEFDFTNHGAFSIFSRPIFFMPAL